MYGKLLEPNIISIPWLGTHCLEKYLPTDSLLAFYVGFAKRPKDEDMASKLLL